MINTRQYTEEQCKLISSIANQCQSHKKMIEYNKRVLSKEYGNATTGYLKLVRDDICFAYRDGLFITDSLISHVFLLSQVKCLQCTCIYQPYSR